MARSEPFPAGPEGLAVVMASSTNQQGQPHPQWLAASQGLSGTAEIEWYH